MSSSSRGQILSELPNHVDAVIYELDMNCPQNIKKKLLALGFISGTNIRIIHRTPLGCPMEIQLDGCHRFFLRRSEAAYIKILSPLDWECESGK
ncbi:MAG: hypothetical protein FJ161_01180 [Gammaproteobacteria bacterium]|nr:hypothetical protein [Gammaproteobacteria bacterium]